MSTQEHMKKLLISAMLAFLVLGCSSPQANGQATDETAEQRKERILTNLKFLFPQLQEHDVVMGELEASGIDGLEQGSFVINGRQTQKFLVTADDKQLFLLAADPLDVSRTSEELAALQTEQEAAAAREAQERGAELAQAVAGLPVRGNPDAPVTIVEFSDFQCPYCARAYNTVEEVLAKYPDDVKLVYVHFPLPNHPWAKPAAIAAVCAAQQNDGAFWTLHDGYFENQGSINPGNVIEKSKAFLDGADIDLDAWAACAGDAESEAYQGAEAAVEGALQMGNKFGVSGTPGFFVNGRFVSGAQPLETFEALISQAKQDVQ